MINQRQRSSGGSVASPPAGATREQLAHQVFGEFKLFKEQQQAIPMRLQVNHRRRIHGEYGWSSSELLSSLFLNNKVQLEFPLLTVQMDIAVTRITILTSLLETNCILTRKRASILLET